MISHRKKFDDFKVNVLIPFVRKYSCSSFGAWSFYVGGAFCVFKQLTQNKTQQLYKINSEAYLLFCQ